MPFSRFGQRVVGTREGSKFRVLFGGVRKSSPGKTVLRIKLKHGHTYHIKTSNGHQPWGQKVLSRNPTPDLT